MNLYKLIWWRDIVAAEWEGPFKKATYLNMIWTDMTEEFLKIKIPTLLLWWEKDSLTPLSDAWYMRLNIKDSEIIVLEGQGHSIHLQNPIELSRNILEFLK